MSTSPARFGKRAAARLRAIRRRAADWRRRTRRALTLAAVAAGSVVLPAVAEAQVGQMAMSPSAGVVNRALAGFKRLDENGPGWMYWGINGADRGLGYVGSYMTVGGFIPYAVDDLGGFWSADLRGHLSVNGGFFSNVGMVRKQFIGGTLLGVGVYWDYDGDQNQYPAFGEEGTIYGQFGHAYNQVGVSGEWLTDWGNLRSNGYIPVGTTAYVAGAPGTPFYDNYVMCQYGLDAALAGADLEVGAYIPGLSDWAGMISVGGYALGNALYDWQVGPEEGQDVVPWFGGVYTRLDMTFLENWDFSLQANNDSYFDWTGFARLTYRMGRSRRRNVPDQMEQPMMRNEHIVRAHETPVVALNPNNGTPWRVIHVDNSSSPAGNGTAEAPFTTIAAANAAATNPWDIVLVARGLSRVNLDNASADFGDISNAYGGTFTPLAANQYFIGEGTPFNIDTLNCGFENIGGRGGIAPVLSNPTGPSIVLSQGLVASNFSIVNSAVGIGGTGNLSSPERGSVARNIDIYATDPTASTQGIAITDATGKATFRDVNIGKQVATKQGLLLEWTMSNGSVLVDGGDPVIDYADGTIRNTKGHILHVNNTLGGEVSLTANPGQPFYERGTGVLVENAAGNVTVTNANPGMQSLDIVSQADGIKVTGSSGVQTFNGVVIAGVSSVNGTVTPNNGYAGVNLQNNAGTTNFDDLTITLTDSANASTGFLAVNDNVINVTGDSSVNVRGAPAVSMTNVNDVDIAFETVTSTNSPTNGLLLDDVGGLFAVSSALNVTDALGDGLVIRNSPDLTFTSAVTNVNTVATAPARANGIVLQNNDVNADAAQLGQVKVTTKNGAGLVVTSAGASSIGGTIDATGGAAITANDADLALTLASVSSTNSNAAGVNFTKALGSVAIEATTVADPVGNGINAVDNFPNFKADFGATTVNGIGNTAAGAIGVNLVNAVEPVPATRYSFDSLDVETVNGAGLVTRNAGEVNFNTPATISAAGGAAIDLENTEGTTGGVAGSGFTFQSLTSTESVSNGVRLNNLNSDLRVQGATSIDSAAGPSILISDNVAPPATDSIAFNTVTITNRGNVGARVDGVYGQVSFQNLSIDNGAGVAGNAVEVVNTTNPADPIGTDSGRVYINGGSISDAQGNGILVQNGLARVSNTTITGFLGQGVLGTAGAGQQTTVEVTGTVLSNTVGINGMALQATGGGIVNGTLLNSQIDVQLNPLDAIVLDAVSAIFVNASGNFGAVTPPAPGAGPFNLNNAAGGVLQIDQGSIADLITVNNGVAVGAVGVTFGGSTPPVPPPTP